MIFKENSISFLQWIFGENWCDGWHSFDVLASTASILNLCVISLDRYWAIKEPMSYPAKMTGKKAAVLIVIVWLCSSAISFPAIAWWRATDPNRPIPKLTCPFTEDLGFLVFRYFMTHIFSGLQPSLTLLSFNPLHQNFSGLSFRFFVAQLEAK